jgi:acetoin utilization deacetylase AcuC-like enzyme
MPPGSGVKEYHMVYHDILPGVVGKFDPDIMLVSAGYDIHASDPLSGIRIPDEGIRNIVDGILSARAVPAVFTLEGGYDLDALAASVLITVSELLTYQ